MSQQDIQAKVRGFFGHFFQNVEFRDDEDVLATGLINSLFVRHLILFLEQEFNIYIEDEDMDVNNFRTIQLITALVNRKTAVGTITPSAHYTTK